MAAAATAARGDEEVEYESDPEDASLPSMRRRDASDEDDEGSGNGDRPMGRRDLRDGDVGSGGDSDGQGAAEVYDDEDVDEYYDEEEEEYEDMGRVLDGEEATVGHNVSEEGEIAKEVRRSVDSDGGRGLGEDAAQEKDKELEEGEEKKENEPFSVPTSGAFYMHDDRFQENGRGRRRRMFGAQKLWDSKDEHTWLHDRFEDMNLRDTHYNEDERRSKGRFRGRGGPGRGGGVRGYSSGRPRSYSEDNDNQNRATRVVRGRGPRRYERRFKNYRENTTVQRKQSARFPAKPSLETTMHSGVGKSSSQSAGVQQDRVIPQKHSFSSGLNSASPPFYPSGSSSQDVLIQKRDVQGGTDSKILRRLQDMSKTSNSSSLIRAKATIDTSDHDKFFYEDPIQNFAAKPLTGSNMQSSGFPWSSGNIVQPPSTGSQGRGSNNSTMPSTHSSKQVGRVSAQVHSSVVHQKQVQPPTLPAASRVTTQHVTHRPGSGNQASSAPRPPSGSSEAGESDSPPASSKSKTSLVVAKGNVNSQGTGRGSLLYGGAQVIGAAGTVGLAHGDKKFPGTPALLPVMQFGGQHPSGLGVPAMGMALPGYVAQPQLGFGNSEMTWVPVLAGATGALGGSYCPPYIALDSSYYANPGQAQSSASSRETGANKSDGSLKSTPQPEVVDKELGQRQNKPRRYSEMSFGQ